MRPILQLYALLWITRLGLAQNLCQCDVLLIIDVSQTVSSVFKAEIKYAEDLMDSLSLGPNGKQSVSIMAFSSEDYQVCNATVNATTKPNPTTALKYIDFGNKNTSKELKGVIGTIKNLSGMTFVGRALQFANKELIPQRRSGGNMAIILIHDGINEPRDENPVRIAETIRGDTKTDIFCVSLNPKLTIRGALRNLSGSPHRVFVGQESLTALREKMKPLVDCTPRRTTPPPTTRPTTPPRTTTRRIRTTQRRTTRRTTQQRITTRPTLPPVTLAPRSTTPSVKIRHHEECLFDLLLLLDVSKTISKEGVEKEKEDLKKIVARFDVGPTKTRVGLLHFASKENIKVEFHLNQHKTIEAVYKGIDNATFGSGTTYINLALLKAYEMLDKNNGARTDDGNVKQLVIVMTDGIQSSETVAGLKEEVDLLIENAAKLRSCCRSAVVLAVNEKPDKYIDANLKHIAGEDGENVFHAHKDAEKARLLQRLEGYTHHCGEGTIPEGHEHEYIDNRVSHVRTMRGREGEI